MKQKSLNTVQTTPTAANLLKAAKVAERAERQREALAETESLLASLLGSPVTGQAPQILPVRKGVKRTMSAATKEKIAEGQRKRWANRTTAAPAATTPAPAPAAKPTAVAAVV